MHSFYVRDMQQVGEDATMRDGDMRRGSRLGRKRLAAWSRLAIEHAMGRKNSSGWGPPFAPAFMVRWEGKKAIQKERERMPSRAEV